jgi:hypothetical protein
MHSPIVSPLMPQRDRTDRQVVMKQRWLAAVLALSACGYEAVDGETATRPAPVADLVSTDVFEAVSRPIVITDIDVLATANIEIVGRGVFEPAGEPLGLVPDWPPDIRTGRLDVRAIEDGVEWGDRVTPVLGVRTTGPKSGLRGVVVSWIDADGNPGSETFDFAVQTCAPEACDRDPSEDEWLLQELGLLFP